MSDKVKAPAHYSGNGIECKDALRSMMSGVDVTPEQAYWWGAIFKYTWRWPIKNGVEDLLKARQCIDYLLESLGGDA